jgi:hypothetical protein
MLSYRLYLFAQAHILTDQAFYAENDEVACSISALVAENCSDRCHGFELWKGTQLLMKEKSLLASETLERKRETSANTQRPRVDSDEDALRNLREAIEVSAAAVAHGAIKLNPELDRSDKLHAWLNEARNRVGQS